MTREEALQMLSEIPDAARDSEGYVSWAVVDRCEELRTYILNSIPTPKVEVVEKPRKSGVWYVMQNGFMVAGNYIEHTAQTYANGLRASLGIGGGE